MAQAALAPGRFRALDAWRGVCALLIVLFHAPMLHVWKDAAAFANLQLCVDFFFVLSGFVLSHAFGERPFRPHDGLRFMGMRFRRLWPLHAIMLAALVLLETAKLRFGHADPGFRFDAAPFSEGHTVAEIVTNLFFLQGFGLHPTLSWNGPSWSIAVEFWVSAVFAGTLQFGPRARAWVFAGLLVVSGAALAIVSPDTIFVSSSWAILRCMLGFFAGCLAYRARVRWPAPRMPFGLAETVALVSVAVAALMTRQGPEHLAVPLVFGLVIYLFSFERGPVSALLKRPLLQALGRWSFAIYLTHGLVFQLVRTAGTFVDHRLGSHMMTFHNGDKLLVAGTGLQGLAATLACIAIVVVPVGAVCHVLVEAPLNRWLARRPRPVFPSLNPVPVG